MSDLFVSIVRSTYLVFRESSPYILFGFAIAGLAHHFIPPAVIMRYLSKGRFRSILLASAIGIPLPLCSCSVLPTAISLKKKGAGNGATVAFLISTPETGVDSIPLTFGLLGGVMALFRPLAAIVTSILAGFATELAGGREKRSGGAGAAPPPLASATACCEGESEARATPSPSPAGAAGEHGHIHGDEDHREDEPDERRRRGPFWRSAVGYAFHDLLDDLAHWLLLGMILAGIVTALVPEESIGRYLGGGLMPMLAMLAIGVPLYMCASASTPVAAALMLKGLSPGAALVFLLAGPATNIGSLVVLLRFLGRRVVAIYLASIAIVALLMGIALDAVFAALGKGPVIRLGQGSAGFLPEPVQVLATIVLAGLLLASVMRSPMPDEFHRLGVWFQKWTGLGVTRFRFARGAAALAFALYLMSALLVVRPGEAGTILRFGRIVRSGLPPGPHLHLPFPFERGEGIPAEPIRKIEAGFRTAPERPSVPAAKGGAPGPGGRIEKIEKEAFFLTADRNIIDVNYTIHYRVKDTAAFAYGLADAEGLVRRTVGSVMVPEIATIGIDTIYTSARAEAEEKVREGAQRLLDGYASGIELAGVWFHDVHAPTDVHFAFRDVASAREDKATLVHKANGYYEETVKTAGGNAARERLEALGYRASKEEGAKGEAAAFEMLEEASRTAPRETRLRLYLEAMERVLPGVRKVIRPGGGALKDLDLWVYEPAGARGAKGGQASGAATGKGGVNIPMPPVEPMKRPLPPPRVPQAEARGAPAQDGAGGGEEEEER